MMIPFNRGVGAVTSMIVHFCNAKTSQARRGDYLRCSAERAPMRWHLRLRFPSAARRTG